MKLYKILETDGSVIRIFSYKEEAEKFLSLDRSLRIETIKVFKQKLKDNVYIKAYTVLGDSILWDANVVIKTWMTMSLHARV